MTRATASAPASIGNVGVGFDVLGLAFDAARDVATAHRETEPGVRLGAVSGLVASLPEAVERNTALTAAASLLKAVGASFGVRLDVHKGVPMSAGMGGSAASAVAAAVAVNALLDNPLPLAALLEHGLEGERVSADPPPWDNVMAALHGGLVIAAREDYDAVFPLTVPSGIETILFHPAVQVETAAARKMLAPQVPFRTTVEHSRRLAAFVAGCAHNNRDLIRLGFEDIFIEPQRAPNLPALGAVQRAAHNAGALGCSFSGSGPSVFAWAEDGDGDAVFTAMATAFAQEGVSAKGYRAPALSAGARIETGDAERNAA
jgi:homoserine kinase